MPTARQKKTCPPKKLSTTQAVKSFRDALQNREIKGDRGGLECMGIFCPWWQPRLSEFSCREIVESEAFPR